MIAKEEMYGCLSRCTDRTCQLHCLALTTAGSSSRAAKNIVRKEESGRDWNRGSPSRRGLDVVLLDE